MPPRTRVASGHSQTALLAASPASSAPHSSAAIRATSSEPTAASPSVSSSMVEQTGSHTAVRAAAASPDLPRSSSVSSSVSTTLPARPRSSPTASPLAAAALAEVDNLSLHFTSLTQHKLSQTATVTSTLPPTNPSTDKTSHVTHHYPAHQPTVPPSRPLLPALTSSTHTTTQADREASRQQKQARREAKRKAQQEGRVQHRDDKHSRAQQQQQRDADRQQRRQLLPVLLAHEQEEEQRLLQLIQHKWRRMEERYSGGGDGGEAARRVVRRVSMGGLGGGVAGGSGGESGGSSYSGGGGMYSPSSPFYFTHFSSYAHHASRIGPRYQSDIQPLLTAQQRHCAAEASRFPEHATPLSFPAAFTSAPASVEYNRRHLSSPPSFPAYSFVLSALSSPQLLAYRREQWAVRERTKDEKRFGSVRVGGRGRRSTRITPGIGGERAGAGLPGGEKRKREARREERGVDSVPVVWERMLNDVGEPMGGGGRERIQQLIDGIGQWRRQQRVERQSSTATARSSLSALAPPAAKRTTAAELSAVDRGRVGGGSRAGGSGGVVGGQQSVSSLATLPLLREKDEREPSAEVDSRRKRSRPPTLAHD